MLQVEAEAWAYRLIRDAETRRRVEDNRAELKSNWPEARDVARQLAGHANAAAGEPILWLFGVDEHSGVVPYQTRNMADWRPQLDAEFEGVAPGMQHFALQWKDRPFEALVFRTDAPPYVVRNPKRGTKEAGPFELDVPWREGSTRSARRAELLLMLRPIGRAPAFTALGVRVQLLADGQILLGAHVYAESPELERILIRAVTASVDFGETSSELREVQQYGDGQDPDVVRTRSHLTVQGAGKIVLQGNGSVKPLPSVKEHVVLTVRFVMGFAKALPGDSGSVNGPSWLSYPANALLYANRTDTVLVNDDPTLPMPGVRDVGGSKSNARQLATILALESVRLVLPNIRLVSFEELAEFRAESKDLVAPFRRAMLRLSKELNGA